MANRRHVEVYSAGCAVCDEAVELVRRLACETCDVTVHQMSDITVARKAKELGIRALPALVVNGILAECCATAGIDEAALRRAGVRIAQ